MHKKGYFFIVDALVGATILFVTIAILVVSTSHERSTVQPFETLNSFTDLLYTREIRDINTDYINQYLQQGNITDSSRTILEQLTVWDYEAQHGCTGCWNLEEHVVEELSLNVQETYGVAITLNNTLLYNRSNETSNEAEVYLTTKRVGIAIVNETDFHGPVVLEVSLWV